MEDLTGKQLGQYQVVASLGDGGMASVYKAYQASMERFVALKILPRHLAAEPDFVSRFKNESKVIASLEHPHILPVYDFGEADDHTYLVMRFIENGQTLGSRLKGQPLAADQIQRLMEQIAAALDYAHARHVIHRDVKPSNVLLDEHGNCLLSDFGLAKVLISSAQLTASGVFLGTPTYASPEQCLGSSDIDQRSDVYSLGVILYEMATGRPPFDADTPMGVVIKHIHDPLPMPRTLNPDLPEAVENVILKALSKEANARYTTAGEMAQAYAAALQNQMSDAGIPSIHEENQTRIVPDSFDERPTTKNRKWITTGILGLILLFICGTGAIWGVNKFSNPANTPTQYATISSALEVLPTLTATPLPPTQTTIPSATHLPTASAILQSSATHSPTAPFESYTVTSQVSTIIRSGPGNVYRWVEGSPFAAGTAFVIEGRSENGEWFFVTLPGEVEGWVQADDLQTDLDPTTLSIIEAPPTPLPAATNTPKPKQPKDKNNPADPTDEVPTPYP